MVAIWLTRSSRGKAGLLEKEFKDLRELLLVAANCKKPDQKGFEKLLAPLQKDIEAISRLKEANRKDRDWFTHLSTVAEGGTCVGWITIVSVARQFLYTHPALTISGTGTQTWPLRSRDQGFDSILRKPRHEGI